MNIVITSPVAFLLAYKNLPLILGTYLVDHIIEVPNYSSTFKINSSKDPIVAIVAKDEDDVVGGVLLASVNNGYVEGYAELLDLCGQTVRNRLRYQDPSRFVLVNSEVVGAMTLKQQIDD